MRLIHTEKNGNTVVKILHNPDYNDYVCQLYVNGEHNEPCDYFSNNKQDALDTAKTMLCPTPFGWDEV